MKQSVKIDIIYFRVERDTKMEFCFNDYDKRPIRTLATAVSDREEFLYALKRAVYRSNTVIVVGGLEGNFYVPNVIGAAIGVEDEKVDYAALGFAEPAHPLVFPKGSIPLLTEANRIGGMLLEKGNQSIIVLSEDATLRHQLLENLIYPYIFDLDVEEADEISMEGEDDEQPDFAEEIVVNQLPNVSDGMFVIADDGSNDVDPEAVEPAVKDDFADIVSAVPSPYTTEIYTGFEEEPEEKNYYDNDEEEFYTGPSVSFGKIVGVIFAILCIGASAAIFTMFFMGLL